MNLNLGEILALVGLVLLLFTGLGRQRQRKLQQSPSPGFLLWQRWGGIAAYACLVLGLLLMWAQK
ncbi:MAG: hypothetical protein AB1491_02885 [Thermodesulfobacteriota bacterium]